MRLKQSLMRLRKEATLFSRLSAAIKIIEVLIGLFISVMPAYLTDNLDAFLSVAGALLTFLVALDSALGINSSATSANQSVHQLVVLLYKTQEGLIDPTDVIEQMSQELLDAPPSVLRRCFFGEHILPLELEDIGERKSAATATTAAAASADRRVSQSPSAYW